MTRSAPENPLPTLQNALTHKQLYMQQRAQIVLMTLENPEASPDEIAARLELTPRTVQKWQQAWLDDGLHIFPDELWVEIESVDETDLVDGVVLSDEDHQGDDGDDIEDTVEDDEGDFGSDEAPRMRLDLEIWETAGVLPTDSMWEAGRKLLRFNLQTLVQYEPIAVLGDDPEGVHKMRVITRRMRSLFDVFRGYLDMEYYKGVRKDLRSVAWVLGTVRDHDVLLMRMDAYIEAELGGDADGLKAVHKAVIKRHKKAHKLMLNMFRDKDYDQFITHLYNLVSDPLKKFPDKSTKKRYTKTAAPLAYRVQEIAPRIIYDCLENVRAYESQLKDAKIDTLHSLRIEFKRVRYTLEFFSDVLGESVLRVIMATTAIQDHLGDLVDTSVGITILEDIREDLPKKKQGALGDYLKYLEKQRKYLKSTFPTAYEAFNQPELREALAEAIGGL